MKPLKAAATTSQPVLTSQQIETIFFKVPELYEIHKEFYDGLFPRVQQWSHQQRVGDLFQKLVSDVDMLAPVTVSIAGKGLGLPCGLVPQGDSKKESPGRVSVPWCQRAGHWEGGAQPTQLESGEYGVLFFLASNSFAWGFECPHRDQAAFGAKVAFSSQTGLLVAKRAWPGEVIADGRTVEFGYKSAFVSTGIFICKLNSSSAEKN